MNYTEKKRIVLLTLSLIISFNVMGQKIELYPNWNVGESNSYLIAESLKLSAMGESRVQSHCTKDITVTVTEKSVKQVKLEWTLKKVQHADSIKSELPDVGINTIAEGLVVKYTVGIRTNYFQLLNFEELKDSIANRLNRNISNLASTLNVGDDKLSMMRAQFLMMYSTRPAIDAIILSDIYKFHQLYGRVYKINSSQTFDQKPVDKSMESPDKVEAILESINDATSSFKVKVVSPFAEKMGWSKSNLSSYLFSIDNNWLVNHKSLSTVEGESSMTNVYEIQKIE